MKWFFVAMMTMAVFSRAKRLIHSKYPIATIRIASRGADATTLLIELVMLCVWLSYKS